MWYYGKKEDTYAPAVNMLLNWAGVEKQDFIDCISGRSFSLYNGKQVHQWFKPRISCQEAIARLDSELFENRGILRCKRSREEDIKEVLENQEIYMIGPLQENVVIPHLKHKMYQGAEHYIVVSRESGDKIIIDDPLGTPMWVANLKDLTELLVQKTFYITWISGKKAAPGRERPNWRNVLRSGFDYHKRYSVMRDSTEQFRYSQNYPGNSTAHIGLQMALNRYIVELREIASAIEMTYGTELAETDILFRRLNRIKVTEEVDKISMLDTEVWEYFYEEFQRLESGYTGKV